VKICAIREAHPLKQGLKLILEQLINTHLNIREAHPLKQGLKLQRYIGTYCCIGFERHIH